MSALNGGRSGLVKKPAPTILNYPVILTQNGTIWRQNLLYLVDEVCIIHTLILSHILAPDGDKVNIDAKSTGPL